MWQKFVEKEVSDILWFLLKNVVLSSVSASTYFCVLYMNPLLLWCFPVPCGTGIYKKKYGLYVKWFNHLFLGPVHESYFDAFWLPVISTQKMSSLHLVVHPLISGSCTGIHFFRAFWLPVISTQNVVFLFSSAPTYFWVLYTNPILLVLSDSLWYLPILKMWSLYLVAKPPVSGSCTWIFFWCFPNVWFTYLFLGPVHESNTLGAFW